MVSLSLFFNFMMTVMMWLIIGAVSFLLFDAICKKSKRQVEPIKRWRRALSTAFLSGDLFAIALSHQPPEVILFLSIVFSAVCTIGFLLWQQLRAAPAAE